MSDFFNSVENTIDFHVYGWILTFLKWWTCRLFINSVFPFKKSELLASTLLEFVVVGQIVQGKKAFHVCNFLPSVSRYSHLFMCVDTEFSENWVLALAVWIEHCVTSLALYILACAGILGCLSTWGSHEDFFFFR